MKKTGEMTEPVMPARTSSRFLERISYAWIAWLPFLIPMFGSLFQAHPTALQLGITFPAVAVFVVVYVWTALQIAKLLNGALDSIEALNRVWWIPIAILSAIGILLSLLNGNTWLGLFIYTSAIAGGLLRNKSIMAVVVILLIDLLAFIGALLTADTLPTMIEGGVLILATGLTTLGLSRSVMTARELHRAREEIARLAIAEERLRIARDLHDLLGHNLSLIALKSELAGRLVMAAPERAVEEIHDIESVAREALRETRETISGYRQPTLDAELHGARELLAAAGIACDLEVENIALPATIEAVLASAVREGVTNVIRHSRAKHCTIRVTQDGQNAGVVVLDDGNGQHGKQGTGALHVAGTSGSGLRGLAERVAVYHGNFAAGVQDGGSFRLAVTLPLKGMAAVRVEAARPDSAAVGENAGR